MSGQCDRYTLLVCLLTCRRMQRVLFIDIRGRVQGKDDWSV